MTSRVGLLEINWPKTIGYYGGIGLALSAELIQPPFALFIAAIPVFKMLGHPRFAKPVRVVGEVLEGAAQPVGGSDEATIHFAKSADTKQKQPRGGSIWNEARALAERHRIGPAAGNGKTAIAHT